MQRLIKIHSDSTITAIFEPILYNLVVRKEGDGQAVVSGGGRFEWMARTYILAKPSAHHHFLMWNDGSKSQNRLVIITQDTTFTALFALDTHTVNVVSNNEKTGTVSGSGDYEYGSTALLTATPKAGYAFLKWSDGSFDNPYQITVEEDLTLTAMFAKADSVVTISARPNMDSMGSVAGYGRFITGQTCTLLATAKDGHRFLKWSDDIKTNPRSIVATENKEFIAYFAAEHRIVVSSDNDDRGDTEGSGIYLHGDTAVLEAFAKRGFRFHNWNDGNNENPRYVTVTSDSNFTAYFVGINSTENAETGKTEIYTNGRTITIKNCAGKSIRVYNTVGHLIAHCDNCPDTQRIEVPLSGLYLVRIGCDEVHKVMVVQ